MASPSVKLEPQSSPAHESSKHKYPVPRPGCYAPAVTFFDPVSEALDLSSQAKYFAYLASTGLEGLVVLGTNAETFLLNRDERKTLVQHARRAVPTGYPLIAGVSGFSTRQVVEYINDAYDAGADYALVLPCAYFGKQTTPAVIKNFFSDVARKSPLPIVLYNFPAVCNGVDLDSEIITELVRQHENIVGVKLTCGSVAKIARLAATFPASRFAVFGGQSDFLLGGLAVGSAGCIAAFANVCPRSVTKVFRLWHEGKYKEALALQQVISLAESPTKAGIASTKFAASITSATLAGVQDAEARLKPRSPYLQPDAAAKARIREIIEPMRVAEAQGT